MSIPFLSNLDMTGNQILNMALQVLTSDPSPGTAGQVYYNSTSQAIRYYNGSTWQNLVTLTSADHHQLINLTNYDDHPQYVNTGVARTITAVHTFNPGSAGAPFILGANAQSQLVTGLNAQYLNGNLSSAFAPVVHTHPHTAITDWATAIEAFTLNQFAAPTASVSMGGYTVTNIATPVNSTDAANKGYVDAARTGLSAKQSCRALYNVAGGTFNITAVPNTVDGVSLNAGDRVLVINSSNAALQGIYTVTTVGTGTNGSWTLATDANGTVTSGQSNVTSGMYALIDQGTTYSGTGWVLTTPDPITVGTTNLTFVQFSGAGEIVGANLGGGGHNLYIGLSGNTLQFKTVSTDGTTVNITDAGNVLTFAVNQSGLNVGNMTGILSVANGGTGAITPVAARTNLSATTKIYATMGDGTTTNFTINHGLNTYALSITVSETSGARRVVHPTIGKADLNDITIGFATAPTTSQYDVTIIG